MAADANRPVPKKATPDDLAETNIADSPEELAETRVAEQSTKPMDSHPRKKSKSSSGPASTKKTRKVTQLGDFKLTKKLGKGGMGTVYLATQVSLDRNVALKTLSPEFAKNESFVQRFLREARSMAKLHHPNIVQVYAADSVSGVHYAAIEFIDGRSMQDWMDELRQLEIGDALHVILICANALKHAHDLNMIHRDIKPDNILVTNRGIVKVADFGLAKALDEDVSMTQSGTGLGTPLYMSPEQARNAKHVDQTSDIYALGCTLYYFVTGDLPFKGDNTLELIMAKEKGKFTPARRLNSKVPERLDLMIDKMMAKDPAHRYRSCDEVIRDLHSIQMENPALSFIESAETSFAPRPAAPPTRSQTTTVPARPASQPLTSAQDAMRTQSTKKTDDGDDSQWFVRHQNADGKMSVSKMTTAQIKRGVKAGVLDLKAKAKMKADDSFLPLAQFAEFEKLMEHRAAQVRAESRSQQTRDMFASLDRQEARRKRWRWLRNLVQNVKGLISLAIWLVVVAAALFALFQFGLPALRQFLGR